MFLGSDLERLYDAAAEIGWQPPGARILDMPSGGGVALRGLRPGQGVEYVAADIAPPMLDRTMAAARARGIADQVAPRIADVENLPIPDGTFDMAVSFTGLHCFPDLAKAVAELTPGPEAGWSDHRQRAAHDRGSRYEPIRRLGRRAKIKGPGCTGAQVTRWLHTHGMDDVSLELSGAIGYFRGVKRP